MVKDKGGDYTKNSRIFQCRRAVSAGVFVRWSYRVIVNCGQCQQSLSLCAAVDGRLLAGSGSRSPCPLGLSPQAGVMCIAKNLGAKGGLLINMC